MQLVLSLFHGVDLFGRGFEQEGFCVVRAAEIILGYDIRDFHAPRGRFDGIIAGTPCQDFSTARRTPPTNYGLSMIEEFTRLVAEASPTWFVLENVPSVPSIEIEGYTVQRFDLRSDECGGVQRRLRHFQFGSRSGLILDIKRNPRLKKNELQPTAMSSEGRRGTRRTFAEFCRVQGLPDDFDLPDFTTQGKYKAVGNGVDVRVARTIARAVRESASAVTTQRVTQRFCACSCGRILTGQRSQRSATPSCRKRLQMKKIKKKLLSAAKQQVVL